MIDQNKEINKLEWNWLIILDAARYDYFEEENYLCGELYPSWGTGLDTPSWLVSTWKDFYDIIYYSANPYVNSIGFQSRWISNDWKPSEHFKIIIDIWSEEYTKHNTTHPAVVNTYIDQLVDKFRDKKAVIHYMQPHMPCIGDTKLSIWKKEELYEMDQEYIRRAYRDNLRFVLKYVNNILDILDGKIVITSDHGDLLGEYGYYSHPPPAEYEGCPEIRKVPWLVIDK